MDQNCSPVSAARSSSTRRRTRDADAAKADATKSQTRDKLAILSIDIGTTNLKCSLYDQDLKILYYNSSKLNILHPRENYSELDPDDLFRILKENVNDCLKKCPRKSRHSSINANQFGGFCERSSLLFEAEYTLKCFGISAQRNSIILWNR